MRADLALGGSKMIIFKNIVDYKLLNKKLYCVYANWYYYKLHFMALIYISGANYEICL